MRRKTVKAIALIIVIAMVLTTFSFMLYLPVAAGAEYVYGATTAQEQRYLNEKVKELENYIKLIHDNYKDEVSYETLMNGAFEGAMYSLGDPYSVYFTDPIIGQAYVDSATGQYEGVGVVININDNGQCEVVSLIPKGPAEVAGILKGDIILKIDGKDVDGISLPNISDMLKGPAGSTVRITIKRSALEQVFTITREVVYTTNVYPEMLEGDIGYILMTGFEIRGAEHFRDAKAELIKAGAKSLIIDVRDNPGGLVSTAVGIAEEFIESGDIVHFASRGKIVETISAGKNRVNKIPTVLLINENSASASEILAAALKDNNAATLVGTTTYGKGVAQVLGYTSSGNMYKISIEYFLTPDKKDIQDIGITPDYVVRNSLGEFREEAFKLYMSFAPFAENTKPKPGDVGLNVFAAQQRLVLLGFAPGLNAVMDADTVAAVKAFQKEQGLYAYGTLDLTTMRKIEEVTKAYVNNDSPEDLQLKKAIELLKK